MRILNADGLHPICAHEGCGQLALDGYCEAMCCLTMNPRRAYCSEHSHRPSRVLEILGYSVDQTTFTRAEVRQIVMGMWGGAGLVYESAGKFDMERDIENEREVRKVRARRSAATTPDGVARSLVVCRRCTHLASGHNHTPEFELIGVCTVDGCHCIGFVAAGSEVTSPGV